MMSLDSKAFMDWAYTVSSGGGTQAAMTAYLAMRNQIGGGSEDNSDTFNVESRVFEANDKRFTVSMGIDGHGKLKIDERNGDGWVIEFDRRDLETLWRCFVAARELGLVETKSTVDATNYANDATKQRPPVPCPGMRGCKHCGGWGYEFAKFCMNCGKPFDAVPAAGVEQSPVTPGSCAPAKPSIKPVVSCPGCGGLNDADNPRCVYCERDLTKA